MTLSPFRLQPIRLNPADDLDMMDVVAKRLKKRVWRELSTEETATQRFVSREFITRDSAGKPRAVADLSHLSSHYKPIMTKNSTLEGFSASLLPEDNLLPMDLSSGYNHFRLHPDMRQYFTVTVQFSDGSCRYFQYIALPFGWSRSGYWFCRLVERFWTMVRQRLSYRVRSYIDDFLIAPSMGRASTKQDYFRASALLDKLLDRYGLTRHPTKGVWGHGSQVLQHLGFIIDTHRGTFGVPAEKLDRVEEQARTIMKLARRNRRRLSKQLQAKFIGTAQSLSLAVPDAAFRLRALYDCLACQNLSSEQCGPPAPSSNCGRLQTWGPHVRSTLSHAALRDLKFWQGLRQSMFHRPI